MSGSGETSNSSIKSNSTARCSGYKDLTSKNKCEESTDLFLYITGSKEAKYFCKASHLTRYIIEHHLSQGKAATESAKTKKAPSKKPAKKKKKIQLDSDHDEDLSDNDRVSEGEDEDETQAIDKDGV